MHPVNLVRIATFLLLVASFPVAAAESPGVGTTEAPKEEVPWRGSSLQYGHTASALSVSRAADPFWNPYYAQSLSLQPQWHFNKHLFASARFELEQELTLADDTTRPHQIMWSDLTLELGTDGLQEKRSGVRLTGSLRVALPTSLAAKAQTRIFSIAPGLSLSRRLSLGAGLTLGYGARYNQRFHRYTTVQFDAPFLAACGEARDSSCAPFTGAGARNVLGDLQQGPFVSFDPTEKVHLYATFWLMQAWLYPLSPATQGGGAPLSLGGLADVSMRETNAFILSAGYDLTRELSLSLASFTFTSQPGLDGLRRSPFFNRNTTVSLGVALDVEALLSRI